MNNKELDKKLDNMQANAEKLRKYVVALRERHENAVKEHIRFKTEAIGLMIRCRAAMEKEAYEDGPTIQEAIEAIGKFVQYEWTLPNQIEKEDNNDKT